MKKTSSTYYTRAIFIGLILALELLAAIAIFCFLYQEFKVFRIIIWACSVVLSLKVATKICNTPCRLGWIIGILALPTVFIPIYFIFGQGGSISKINKYIDENYREKVIRQPAQNIPEDIKRQFLSLSRSGNFPIYENTKCVYLKSGEEMFSKIKEIIHSAHRYIFLEFFIIEKSVMWSEILELLKQKAAQGIKVYVMADDVGTITLLPSNYKKILSEFNIEFRRFNCANPIAKPDLNYRDHRKIVVADGNKGITGGANIADEYINLVKPYGYWKDTAVSLEGEGAFSLAEFFVLMWNFSGGELDIHDFTPENFIKDLNAGLSLPFCDYPTCTVGHSEQTFINIIFHARKKVVITTPYLAPDAPLVSALCRASEMGTEIILITPKIPDKRYIHVVTRANYLPLLNSGVRVFEYLPGFIHAKSILADDDLAYVGSANLDCRSLYLLYECGVLMYKTEACDQLREDLADILTQSKEIHADDTEIIKAAKSLEYRLLRLITGLL